MKSTVFLFMLAAASLLACGKPEEPVVAPPAAAEPSRQAVPHSAAPSTALTEIPTAQPEAVAVEPTKSDPAGQLIYRQACAFCHGMGIAGAPKIGDAAAWNARVAQGMNTLYASALQGKNAMPAKGGNPALADSEVKAAVDFMVTQSR
jgi:cytochrome c5